MKKFFLVLFILLDMAVIVVSGLFLMNHIQGSKMPQSLALLSNRISPPTPGFATPISQSTGAISATPTAPGTNSTPKTIVVSTTPAVNTSGVTTSQVAAGATRNILFSYRNSKAKKVMIRADFTGWRAEPMKKDSTGTTWKYMASLEPGEYAYLYSVDDHPKLDPANKHTKQVGKTTVSAIVVQPAGAPH
jgi:hypothetical protein